MLLQTIVGFGAGFAAAAKLRQGILHLKKLTQ